MTTQNSMWTELKKLHPYYYAQVERAGDIALDRLKKYTGDDPDPFANFITTSRIRGKSVQDVMIDHVCQKLSRILLNNQDFDDESFRDSIIDMANFALLLAAWVDTE